MRKDKVVPENSDLTIDIHFEEEPDDLKNSASSEWILRLRERVEQKRCRISYGTPTKGTFGQFTNLEHLGGTYFISCSSDHFSTTGQMGIIGSATDSSATSFLDNVSSSIAELKVQVDSLQDALSEAESKHEELLKLVLPYLATMANHPGNVGDPLSRVIPGRIFLTDANEEQGLAVTNAFRELLETEGFEICYEGVSQVGSWFKELFVRSKEKLSEPENQRRLEKLERAIEMQGLGKIQAEIDEKQANAVANLIKSLDGVGEAVLNAGSIYVFKLKSITGESLIHSMTLTQDQIINVARNPNLMNSPRALFEALNRVPTSLCIEADSDESDEEVRSLGNG